MQSLSASNYLSLSLYMYALVFSFFSAYLALLSELDEQEIILIDKELSRRYMSVKTVLMYNTASFEAVCVYVYICMRLCG